MLLAAAGKTLSSLATMALKVRLVMQVMIPLFIAMRGTL